MKDLLVYLFEKEYFSKGKAILHVHLGFESLNVMLHISQFAQFMPSLCQKREGLKRAIKTEKNCRLINCSS